MLVSKYVRTFIVPMSRAPELLKVCLTYAEIQEVPSIRRNVFQKKYILCRFGVRLMHLKCQGLEQPRWSWPAGILCLLVTEAQPAPA